MSSVCSNDFNEGDLIRLVKEAVMFSPIVEGNPCQRIQSFAYVKSWVADGIPNFEIMINDPKSVDHAFIRNKDELYPICTLNVETIEMLGPFQKMSKDRDRFELAIIDRYIADCDKCKYCGKRDKEQIKIDVRKLWHQVIDYIREAGYFKINDGQSITYSWENENYIAHRVADGDDPIQSADLQYAISNQRWAMWEEDNANVKGGYVHMGDFLVGIVGTISLRKEVDSEDVAWNFQKFKNMIHKSR